MINVHYPIKTYQCLWSQKTLYDFSDLQITGEFENRPGTGRIFPCVVTGRTGAGRRLYMITAYGFQQIVHRRNKF